jgi:predicted DNA-binding helix-hairpin-helix protein
LPLVAAPLMREHRLYQADWMLRFYGFQTNEIVTAADGLLDLAIDPKLAWALANRDKFPVDVNTADRELLLRVPGLGVRTIDRILMARRLRTLGLDDVQRIARSIEKSRPFLIARDWRPVADIDNLRAKLTFEPAQMDLFA